MDATLAKILIPNFWKLFLELVAQSIDKQRSIKSTIQEQSVVEMQLVAVATTVANLIKPLQL